jgi:S-adenosylmethionine decarboxylase
MEAEIFETSLWIEEIEPELLKELFSSLLKRSEFTILNFTDHHFSPYGYTALWLLGESHFAIHTFPEKQRSYIQLSSCSKEMFDTFLELLSLELDDLILENEKQ